MWTSQVVALATTAAMVVSGTVVLLVLRLNQKTLPGKSPYRPCITSSSSSSSGTEDVHDGGTRSRGEKQSSSVTNRRKKNKGVRFADDVADPTGYNKTKNNNSRSRAYSSSSSITTTTTIADKVNRGMPENRMALYNGILRDRIIHRVAYSD